MLCSLLPFWFNQLIRSMAAFEISKSAKTSWSYIFLLKFNSWVTRSLLVSRGIRSFGNRRAWFRLLVDWFIYFGSTPRRLSRAICLSDRWFSNPDGGCSWDGSSIDRAPNDTSFIKSTFYYHFKRASASFFRASFIAIIPFLVFLTETMSLNRATPRSVKHSPWTMHFCFIFQGFTARQQEIICQRQCQSIETRLSCWLAVVEWSSYMICCRLLWWRLSIDEWWAWMVNIAFRQRQWGNEGVPKRIARLVHENSFDYFRWSIDNKFGV